MTSCTPVGFYLKSIRNVWKQDSCREVLWKNRVTSSFPVSFVEKKVRRTSENGVQKTRLPLTALSFSNLLGHSVHIVSFIEWIHVLSSK